MKKKIAIIGLTCMLLMSTIMIGFVTGAPPEDFIFLLIPDHVYEGDNFSVTLQGGDVEGVNVTLWEDYPFTYHSSNFTDENGFAILEAPFVYSDTGFYTTASRNGAGPEDPGNFTYVTINVWDGADNLVIDAPSSVNEEEDFEVIVTANNHYPVENAMVTVGDGGTGAIMSFTNENGVASFIAPKVDENTSIEILASKEGYYEDSENILVINVLQLLEFQVAPDSVDEGEVFAVRITNGHIAVEGVEITPEWGDETYLTDESGWVTLTAPYVDETRTYALQATKTGYLDVQISITIEDIPTPELVVTAPSSILEGEMFTATVISEDNPIEDAQVTFAGENYYTDQNGAVNLAALLVDENTTYSITAIKDGYEPGTTSIMVLDTEPTPVEPIPDGLIYGIISDNSGNPIGGAYACVILEDDGSIITSKCTLTNEDGGYSISVPIGAYDVTASKIGYSTSTASNVVVESGKTIEQSFVLEKEPSSVVDNNQEFIENKIQEQVDKGTIWAEISIPESGVQEISSYSTNCYITDLTSFDGGVSFEVSTTEGVTVKLMVIQFEDGTPSDFDNGTVSFDGVIIEKSEDVNEFFDVGNNQNPEYLLFTAGDDSYFIIKTPFSTEPKTVKISSNAESLLPELEIVQQPVELIAVLAIAVIAAAAFVMFRKNGEE